MNLALDITDRTGHTEAAFDGDSIRISFRKTTPEERGLIDAMIDKAKKENMVLNTVDKDGNLKPIEDLDKLSELFKSKNEIMLKGTAEAVKRIALDLVEKEIGKHRLVMVAQDNGQWKIVREKEDFKPSEEKKNKVESHEVPSAG